ncbi:hypothetical protein P3X46_025004 [Hevea brasiliensis]|uniref:Cyclase family protein n=1 Tax=Hevea brasiliensis TaxID=3981 RepID=A0ABQ9L6X0_HEVBR|nr:cyclase-like protein 2 isoform X2 [Hevea brasiliensis]KAJ9159498.1 hypothetical protein P3X46_025004 [Hevea brasiliensis]
MAKTEPKNITSLLLLVSLLLSCLSTASTATYPTIPGTADTSIFASQNDNLIPVRREVYGNGRIFDITHRYTSDMPWHGSDNGLGQFLWLQASMKNGSFAYISDLKISVHAGTHVDTPANFFEHYFEAGFDVDTLDLEVLNADVMKSLNIPKGIRRVLFRTLNTHRGLMFKPQFDTSFAGFTVDGAKWLVENTDIKLVGIDYLSVGVWSEAIPTHLIFLESREIILVEGLKLDNVNPGIYSVHCLPLRLLGSEGSPVRCILIKR